jgi:hypothetical protein
VISALTTVLKNILKREIEDELDTTLSITTQAPHTIGSEPQENGLNIFLYQVMLNSGYFNNDLPRRDLRGALISSPLVGLDLYYLLTPFSNKNDEIMTQKILASTIRILHEKSVLTRQLLEHEFGLIEASDPDDNALNSGLAEQNESVTLANKPLSVEELTKLWSSYFQTNYRLSVAYVASPVLIESKRGPIHPLPVQERKIFVLQFRSPVIERIEPPIIEWHPDVNKRRIDITGRNLSSDHMKVVIEQKAVPADHVTVISNERISVNLPDTANLPDHLSAGTKRLKIVHAISDVSDGVGLNSERIAYESNTSHFILAPHLITEFPLVVEQNTTFELKFKPPLQENQKVEVIVGESTFSQDNKSFPTESINVVTTEDWQPGTFLFRLRINGAESFLQAAADKTYIGPKIEVKDN